MVLRQDRSHTRYPNRKESDEAPPRTHLDSSHGSRRDPRHRRGRRGRCLFDVLSPTRRQSSAVPVGNSEPAASTSALTIGEIYRRSYKGVVEITVTSSSSEPVRRRQRLQQAQGSGFVYDSDGHIVTNEHVVDGAQSVSVRFWNGDTYKATVVGSDPSTDLAVIKVDAPESILSPLAVGDSAKVLVGDGVVAIGSPFGLEETVTSGIVSALHRQMQAPNNFTINDSIQTDAAINHGNSGGPLLNSEGQVIGVNAQIRSDGGGSDGVGFAIPSNTITSIATQLIESGKVEHAYLGVSVQTIPESVASDLGLVAGVELSQGDERDAGRQGRAARRRPARRESRAMRIRPEATCSPRSTARRSRRPRSSSARSTRSTPATRSRSRTGGTARATRPM